MIPRFVSRVLMPSLAKRLFELVALSMFFSVMLGLLELRERKAWAFTSFEPVDYRHLVDLVVGRLPFDMSPPLSDALPGIAIVAVLVVAWLLLPGRGTRQTAMGAAAGTARASGALHVRMVW